MVLLGSMWEMASFPLTEMVNVLTVMEMETSRARMTTVTTTRRKAYCLNLR